MTDILPRLAAAERESVQTRREIERLTGELERILQREDDSLKEVMAERDLWRKRHDKELAAHGANLREQRKVEAERDRYRAALDRIANQSARDYDDPEQEAYASRQIARQALGEDAKPMSSGARRSQCPACGWTFGTHAPDCEVKS